VVTKNSNTPYACWHTTLYNTNVGKQAISDTLQGSVATYLRRGECEITKLRKINCLIFCEKTFKIGEYLADVTSKKVVVSCTLCEKYWHYTCKNSAVWRCIQGHVTSQKLGK